MNRSQLSHDVWVVDEFQRRRRSYLRWASTFAALFAVGLVLVAIGEKHSLLDDLGGLLGLVGFVTFLLATVRIYRCPSCGSIPANPRGASLNPRDCWRCGVRLRSDEAPVVIWDPGAEGAAAAFQHQRRRMLRQLRFSAYPLEIGGFAAIFAIPVLQWTVGLSTALERRIFSIAIPVLAVGMVLHAITINRLGKCPACGKIPLGSHNRTQWDLWAYDPEECASCFSRLK